MMAQIATNQLMDLSHPITDHPSCSFQMLDTTPQVSFQEGDAHGVFFVTTRLDNLMLNLCTHIDFPGHLHTYENKFLQSVGEYPLDRFIGAVAVIDVSDKMSAIK